MKNKIFLVIFIAVIYLFVSRETVMDKLLEVEFPIVTTEGSGIQYFDPEANSVVDVADQLESGLVTMVYFFNSKCKSCQIFDTNLNKLFKFRPDIAVTKMPVQGVRYKVRYHGEKLNVKGLPFIMIFDRAGKLLVADDGDNHDGYEAFYEWLQEEVNRKNAQLKEEWEQKRK